MKKGVKYPLLFTLWDNNRSIEILIDGLSIMLWLWCSPFFKLCEHSTSENKFNSVKHHKNLMLLLRKWCLLNEFFPRFAFFALCYFIDTFFQFFMLGQDRVVLVCIRNKKVKPNLSCLILFFCSFFKHEHC